MIDSSVGKPTAAFFSPYFHILGGGERYFLSIANVLSKDFEVSLYGYPNLVSDSRKRFGIDIKNITLNSWQHFSSQTGLERFKQSSRYDVIFYMTDGSVFATRAKKKFLMIQSPAHMPSLHGINRVKLSGWIPFCYSQFVAGFIEKNLGKKACILPACIDVEDFKSSAPAKKKIILTVGRFFKHPHDKKQAFLLDVFVNDILPKSPGWQFIIAGGLNEDDGKEVVKNLKKKAKNKPVEIIINPSYETLRDAYKAAAIYWHGAGFGEDLEKYPERAEHFGITTLEAMASGCVPIVFDGGGQSEIVTAGSGVRFKTRQELIKSTLHMIANLDRWTLVSKSAVDRAETYSCRYFYEKVYRALSL